MLLQVRCSMAPLTPHSLFPVFLFHQLMLTHDGSLFPLKLFLFSSLFNVSVINYNERFPPS